MAWIYLALAGGLEIVWAYFMKKSEGFSLLTPSVITIVTMIGSFALLSIAMRTLPLGTAYAIWTGIGAVGIQALGHIALVVGLGQTDHFKQRCAVRFALDARLQERQ